MDQRITKLNHRLDDLPLATALVNAGLTTPRKIKAASDKALGAIPTIGDATVQAIRQKIG